MSQPTPDDVTQRIAATRARLEESIRRGREQLAHGPEPKTLDEIEDES